MELNKNELRQSIAKDIISKLLEKGEVTGIGNSRYSINLYYGEDIILSYSDPEPQLEEISYSSKGVVTLWAKGVPQIELNLSETEKFNMYQAIKSKVEESEIDILSKTLRSIGSKASSIDELD